MMSKRTIDTEEAIRLWVDCYYSANMISKAMGFSRAGVIKCLNRNGIDTSKANRVTLLCSQCGKPVSRTKARARAVDKPYCSRACYHAAIHNKAYRPWRHGQRMARTTVEAMFPLMPGNVVHHEDGDNHNNSLNNLMVFASQAEHMCYHRARGNVRPIYVGAEAGAHGRTM